MPARSEMSTSLPITHTPRLSAVSAMVIGESTCSAMTSMPWSAKALTASASCCGSHHPPVHTTVVVASGLTLCAPSVKALIDRKSFYRLVELGCEETVDGVAQFGVWSDGMFFAFIPADELAEGS